MAPSPWDDVTGEHASYPEPGYEGYPWCSYRQMQLPPEESWISCRLEAVPTSEEPDSCLKSSHKPTTLYMMLFAHHLEEDAGQTGYRKCTSAMLT